MSDADDSEDSYEIFVIEVEGVPVRHKEEMHQVSHRTEGDLARGLVAAIVNDLKNKLSGLEGVPYLTRELN